MNDFLLFLHLFGLMLGAAGGIASGIIMRRMVAMPPEARDQVKQFGPIFANVSATGLVLLWLTGLVMVFTIWGGFGSLPALFWVKIVFVLALTVLVGLTHMTYANIRRTGNASLASRFRVFGPASGLSAMLAVLFAVYAFH